MRRVVHARIDRRAAGFEGRGVEEMSLDMEEGRGNMWRQVRTTGELLVCDKLLVVAGLARGT